MNERGLLQPGQGQLEQDLAKLDFCSLTFVRPGLIGGKRKEVRPAEEVASVVLTLLRPILPRRFRINPAATIAPGAASCPNSSGRRSGTTSRFFAPVRPHATLRLASGLPRMTPTRDFAGVRAGVTLVP